MRLHRSNKSRDHRDVTIQRDGLSVPPAPSGYEYRWIRVRILGTEDAKNIGKRFRLQKWEPVKAEDVPEDWRLEVSQDGRFQGCVQNGDLILAKNTSENLRAIRESVAQKTALLEQGIRARLRAYATTDMPFIEDEDFNESTPRKKGRRVNLQED